MQVKTLMDILKIKQISLKLLAIHHIVMGNYDQIVHTYTKVHSTHRYNIVNIIRKTEQMRD